jgi:hypothetical protein
LLFDKITSFNNLLNVKCIKNLNFNSIAKFCKILSNNNLINLTKLIETVLCIPIGNDFVERVFSLMHRIWRDDRNQMSVELVKSEICINVNFFIDCIDFKSYFKSNEKLLSSVKSSQKYNYT